jgi:hypothetical protein
MYPGIRSASAINFHGLVIKNLGCGLQKLALYRTLIFLELPAGVP